MLKCTTLLYKTISHFGVSSQTLLDCWFDVYVHETTFVPHKPFGATHTVKVVWRDKVDQRCNEVLYSTRKSGVAE